MRNIRCAPCSLARASRSPAGVVRMDALSACVFRFYLRNRLLRIGWRALVFWVRAGMLLARGPVQITAALDMRTDAVKKELGSKALAARWEELQAKSER